MARPHASARFEDGYHRRLNSVLRRRGWVYRPVGYTGYGSTDFVRVLGRVLVSRPPGEEGEQKEPDALKASIRELRGPDEPRGWRAFLTAAAMHQPITITIGGESRKAQTDRGGYVDAVLSDISLEPGWHDAVIEAPGGAQGTARVLVVSPDVTFGLVSDIDDTVITTMLPRPMIAAWNTFVKHETARRVVSGMAPMYRELLAENEGAPIVYLSTGAWNTAPTLTRFLERHGYPIGPLLLTDWGPTNTGWFRSGQEHKREVLHRLAREFPQIRWVLVGDDGQHDPRLYGDFARDRPDVVRAIGIRELTPTEQVLSHGIPVSNEEFAPAQRRTVPVVRAPDGYRLRRLLRATLG